MAKRFGFLCLCLLTGTLLAGQSLDQEKLREAKVFFSHQRYAEALVVLSSSRQLSRSDKEARFLIAVCQYQTNKLDEALQTLTQLIGEDKSAFPETWLYLAKVYHAQHRFKEASDQYKTYLKAIFPNDPNRRMVIEEIKRCANGIDLQFQSATAVAENLGPGINSGGDEFAPVSSPNFADRLYFSAIRPQNTGGARDAYGNPDPQWGNYYSDLYSSQVVRGTWGQAKPMHYLLNSPKHEILLGFSDNGRALYYFKGLDFNRGEIVVDTFREVEERTLSSTPLAGPLRPDLGDSYPVFYRDTLMIFTSNRPGGYGGWDLYKCRKEHGRWLLPVNLGPTVNTAYDETTPFLANDGQTLYFSSNDSRKSIGGLDIFKTYFIPQKDLWLPPTNIGMPINSAGDDLFFKISRDGFTAYFTSSRKDGYGKMDIYAAHFQDFLPEMEFPTDYFTPPSLPVSNTPVSPAPRMKEDPMPANEAVISGSSDFSPDNGVDFGEEPGASGKAAPPGQSASLQSDPPVAPAVPVANPAGYTPILLEDNTPAASQYDRLDRLSDELTRRPDLLLVITAYHEKAGATGEALFSAISKAETVAGYLQRKGVAGQQLFMRGVLVSSGSEKQQEVELAFTTSSGRPAGQDLPSLGAGPSGLYSDQTINEPLHYKIQVASAQRALRESYLEGFPDPMIEKSPDFAFYRYTLGAFTDRTEAERFRQKMRDNGRGSAYLATYREGRRLER